MINKCWNFIENISFYFFVSRSHQQWQNCEFINVDEFDSNAYTIEMHQQNRKKKNNVKSVYSCLSFFFSCVCLWFPSDVRFNGSYYEYKTYYYVFGNDFIYNQVYWTWMTIFLSVFFLKWNDKYWECYQKLILFFHFYH